MNIAENQPEVLGRLGRFVVKIAVTPQEITAAQELRYAVFRQSATGHADVSNNQRDEDHFDAYCDHLIVCEEPDDCGKDVPKVIATYRLMGPEQAKRAGGYYSAGEFDVETLIARHEHLRFLELGRSCVLEGYRDKRTIELLWHGSWAYVCKNGFDVMFGCASFPGTDPKDHETALAFLRNHAGPDAGWETNATAPDIVCLQPFPGEPDLKTAMRSLPPLIKGYLRLGAMFARDAVIDYEFNTIDILVLLPVARLNPRYVNYYGEKAERHAI